ncbi:hypothetical protein HNY73_013156 [Argiope bruennichi]|uniref:Uncharacterized protein n=1 Tax=Argiope bruennichi TaxID=94029 RepID=A0A8T0EX48_ARGBR|nr:hypothetical protein HNY73_013156 [Argiope bruennichi]
MLTSCLRLSISFMWINFFTGFPFLYLSANPLHPINFEFHHRESLIISSNEDDDDVKEYDYDYDDHPNTKGNSHIRKKREAKWSPDYDLYGQWAEEYYAQYESAELSIAGDRVPKGDIIDQLLSKTPNKTEEELLKRESDKKKKAALETGLIIGTWIVGILVVTCVVYVLAKRVIFRLFCDFCDVLRFKDKTSRFLSTFEPGVYVHKNGEKEHYSPTEEELEALKEVRKLMYSVY